MSTNCSNLSFLQQNPSCENWAAIFPVKISQMVVLSIIFFFSLVGNTLLIITVYKRKELRKTVNYFIVNMAFSDFVFPLTAIPVSLAELSSSSWQWPIGGTAGLILCKLRNYAMTVSSTTQRDEISITMTINLGFLQEKSVNKMTSSFEIVITNHFTV